MDRNNMDENNRWVEEQMAKLKPEEEWQPKVPVALARVEERRAHRRAAGRWTWIASAATAAAILGLLAFPQPRAFAARAIEPGVAAGEDLFNPAEIHNHLFQMMWAVHQLLGLVPPNIALTDSTGANFRLSDYHGKVVLVNFFPAGCRACQDEIPWLVEFQRTHDERKFAVLGVPLGEDGWKAVRPLIASMQINYRVAVPGDAGTKSYGADSLPQTLLLDRGGLIVVKHVGIMSKSQYEREIVQKVESRWPQFDGSRAEGH
jgi:peroxiredoxin